MNTFDPYTRSVILESLQPTGAGQTGSFIAPKNPKKGQKFRDRYGRTFIWNGTNWDNTTQKAAEKAQGGVGFQGDILPPPIKRVTKDGKPDIIPAPKETILYGLSEVPSGYDPQAQAAIYNYYGRLNKYLEGVSPGYLVDLVGQGIGGVGVMADVAGTIWNAISPRSSVGSVLQTTGRGLGKLGRGTSWLGTKGGAVTSSADYALKQAIRSALAAAYLGYPEKGLYGELFGGSDDDSPEAKIRKEIQGFIPDLYAEAGLDPEKSRARFGKAGERMMARIPEIAAMGYDPMEYVLNKFGAQEASKSIANSAAKEAEQTLSAGGWLRRGRELGAFK